jgi:hypothetical protein
MQGSVDWNKALDLIEVAHFASRKIVEEFGITFNASSEPSKVARSGIHPSQW